MRTPGYLRRRKFLALGAGLLTAGPALLRAGTEGQGDPDEGVTAPEDLMKEHGVLNRCLLVYEEGLRRLTKGKNEVSPEVFNHTAQLIRHFVEEYHERNEEQFIFPQFEQAQRLVDLVTLLKTQHQAGRRVTADILLLSEPHQFRYRANRRQLAATVRLFIRMYRPHEAREDTVLFPALRTILRPKEVLELGEKMEANEQQVLGSEGFEKSVEQVATLEKQLGIYNLAQFTPQV